MLVSLLCFIIRSTDLSGLSLNEHAATWVLFDDGVFDLLTWHQDGINADVVPPIYGGDTIDDAIHQDSSSNNVHLLRIRDGDHGLQIRLILHSAYGLSCRMRRHQSFYDSQE